MFKRALLGLLMICLALPAMAMTGHCATPSHQTASCHEGKAHKSPAEDSIMTRDCIGCVTPPLPVALVRASDLLVPESLAPLHDDASSTTRGAAPPLPPPRA